MPLALDTHSISPTLLVLDGADIVYKCVVVSSKELKVILVTYSYLCSGTSFRLMFSQRKLSF